MTIAAILQSKGSEVLTVDVATSVRDVVALLAEHRIGAVPVTRGGEVAGIMSERDVIYCLRTDGAAVLDWPVEQIMTAPAITVEPDHQVLSALSLMTRRRIRHLPVVQDGMVLGVVGIRDVMRSLVERLWRDRDADARETARELLRRAPTVR